MPASKHTAIVVDVEASTLDHPNGPKFIRMVLTPANAKALREALENTEKGL
jgi:hypothetical protein